jgi:hypothetical protein
MMGRQTGEQSQRFSSPISGKLADEFFEAVREYIRWSFGSSGRGDVYRYLVRISLVCGRIDGYADLLPDEETLMAHRGSDS